MVMTDASLLKINPYQMSSGLGHRLGRVSDSAREGAIFNGFRRQKEGRIRRQTDSQVQKASFGLRNLAGSAGPTAL